MDDFADDDRAVELETIAAIFPELQRSASNPFHATLDLKVAPLRPLKVRFEEDSLHTQIGSAARAVVPATIGARDKNGREDVCELEHLPPLRLEIDLVSGYPTEQPPLVELSAEPNWLGQAQLQQLKLELLQLWEDIKDQSVYMMIDHLQQGAEQAFGLHADGPVILSSHVRKAMMHANQAAKRALFEQESFDCAFCLEPKKGRECHRLALCGHVFCIACLQDFFGSCITEGEIDNVKCINPSCGKDAPATTSTRRKRPRDRTLQPSELLQIPIGEDLVKRYVHLKRKRRLEIDKTTIYCPRRWCQGVARTKKHLKPAGPMDDFSSDDSEAEVEAPEGEVDLTAIPIAERIAVCDDCDLAFCIVCKRVWHGVHVVDCYPRDKMELDAEEQATRAYLAKHSSHCPTCTAVVQKIKGCNHMRCSRCGTHFCYICTSWLDANDPYSHYRAQPGRPAQCAGRLFEGANGDGDVDPNAPPPANDFEVDEEEEQVQVILDLHRPQLQPAVAAPPVQARGDDSDDDDPPPDMNPQRRQERAIEFVNFNGLNGPANRRVVLPEPAPPPAPAPAPQAVQQPARHRNRNRRRRGPPAGPAAAAGRAP
jgi:E3 ubiquitin-protein ligase RNF14